VNHERHAVGVDQQHLFQPEFTAVKKASSRGIPTTEAPHQNAIDHRKFSLDDTRLSKDREGVGVHSLLDPAGVPMPKAAMSHSRRAAELQRRILPATSRHEHKPEYLHNNPMRFRGFASALPSRLLNGGGLGAFHRRNHLPFVHLPPWLLPGFM